MQNKKYIILGVALIIFIVIFLGLVLNSNKGFNKIVFDSKSIDSIAISGSQYKFVITSSSDISAIADQLSKSTRTHPDRTNINTDFTDLNFYLKNNNVVERVRINNNAYHGTLIQAHNFFYKNDTLAYMIGQYSKQVNYLQH